MDLAETRRAVAEAKRTLSAADNVAGDMAFLLKGRLRKVPGYLLRDLKRELQNFNMQTYGWKD